MKLHVSLSLIFWVTMGFAQSDFQCRRSDFNINDLFGKIYTSTCETQKSSIHCQAVYNKIEKGGESADDYKLHCDDRNGDIKQDLGQFYLGCYIGVFDATAGDLIRFLGESVAKGISDYEINKDCDAKPEYKRMLYLAHNVSSPEDLQIPIPSDARLRAYNCATIRQAIVEEHRYLLVKKKRKVVVQKQTDSQGVTELAKGLLRNLGIRLDCYNSRKQAELLCKAATYVGVTFALPISVVAKIRAAAGFKNIVTVEASTKVGSLEVAAKTVEEVGVLSKVDAPEDIALLEQMVSKGLLTQAEMHDVIKAGKFEKIKDLHYEGKIPESDYGKVLDAFRTLETGKPTGKEVVIEFIPKRRADGAKSKLNAQSFDPTHEGTHGMALIDPGTKKPIATLNYSIEGNSLDIYYLRVKKTHRDFGYSEILFESVLKAHPEVKVVNSSLSGTNEAILLEALKTMPLKEAIKKTPAYRVRERLGFEKIRPVVTIEDDGSMSYSLFATRP